MSLARAQRFAAGPAAAFLVAFVVVGQPAEAQEVPAIYLYVNDRASPSALYSFEWEDLDSLCYQIDKLTGAEVAILVVNSTAPFAIEEYALRTFEENGIGKEGKDNGVLILLTTDDNAWRIEVGYGLEYVLTDSRVGRFAREWLEPALEIPDYGGGLYDLTLAIGQYIVDNYEEGTPTDPSPWVLDWKGIAVGVVVLLVLGGLTRGRIFFWVGNVFKRGGFGGGRSGGGGASGRR